MFLSCFTCILSFRSPNRTASILVFPPGLKIAWQSITLAKILPRPDSRHGSLRMSLVFVQSTRALNSSATLRAVREEHLSDDIYSDQLTETQQRRFPPVAPKLDRGNSRAISGWLALRDEGNRLRRPVSSLHAPLVRNRSPFDAARLLEGAFSAGTGRRSRCIRVVPATWHAPQCLLDWLVWHSPPISTRRLRDIHDACAH